MDDDQLLLLALLLYEVKKKRKMKRRYWVHPLNCRRLQDSQFHMKHAKMRYYPDNFFKFYRMSVTSFDELLGRTREKLVKKDTHLRVAISCEERLAITLRYLATGRNFEDLQFDYLMGSRTISGLVKETCKAIWDVLQPLEMKIPASKERWQEISDIFYRKTNFPNCCGAVDGKHIRLICPQLSGSHYYNYKTFFSIVLMAVVDADYRFIAIDVGSFGKESDSQIFKTWAFGKKFSQNSLNLPDPKPLPNTSSPLLPYIFLGDEAFPLNTNFMKPYPRHKMDMKKRVFNYRLCRSRRVVECAFGILSNKWRIFHTNMCIPPDFATLVTKTACVLHNFVRARDGYRFEDTLTHYFDDNPYRSTIASSNQGRNIRDLFSDYFISTAGEIPWQYQ